MNELTIRNDEMSDTLYISFAPGEAVAGNDVSLLPELFALEMQSLAFRYKIMSYDFH